MIISTIGGFQLFTEPLLFNSGSSNYQGGSLRQSQTVAMYVYENAFVKFDFGYASAVAWVLFLIILLAAAAQLRRRPSPRRHVGPGLSRGAEHGSRRRRPRRRRRRRESGAEVARAGPLVYVVLALGAALSVFPLYFMFVVATRTNDTIGALPPVLTPGGNLGDNIDRLLANEDAHFLRGLVNSVLVSAQRDRRRWCSSPRWPASPSPSCASAAATCCCW